jgi:hypothetical protein
MEKVRHSDMSPQAPRIPKPQDLYSRYQAHRASKEEEKRVEQNYFMRRVLFTQRGKPSGAQDLSLASNDESQETIQPFPVPDEKRRPTRNNQPRQKPQEKKEPTDLNSLTNIVMEMKEMLSNMPNLNNFVHNTYEHKKKNSTTTPKTRSREISLHDKSARKSMRLKNQILQSKPSRRYMSSKVPRPGTNSKYSRPLPVIKNKPVDEISAIQNYFMEFHEKSKFLLKNLEKSVLGENKVV